MIKPRTQVPSLSLDLINDTRWDLEEQTPNDFTMLVFYRGLHCPVCKDYLEDLASKLDQFTDRGMHVIAISCDTEEKAKKAGKEWNIPDLPVGFELSIEKAREYGLFISKGISDKEPEHFSEPGIFLVKPNGKLYCAALQTMPFARPNFDDILKAVDFVTKESYPARGEA